MNLVDYQFSHPETQLILTKDSISQNIIYLIDSTTSSEIILSLMNDLFTHLIQIIDSKTIFKNLVGAPHDSHSKILFFEEYLVHGNLRFEKMQFFKGVSTVLHSHPEYLVDEIMSGSLLEQNFEKNIYDLYTPLSSRVRQEGHRTQVYDPLNGHPHKVVAQGADCLTLCLYLGKNYVTRLDNF